MKEGAGTKACIQQGSETQDCRWPRLESRQKSQTTVFNAPLKASKELAWGDWVSLFSCAGEGVDHVEWPVGVWSWKQKPEEGQTHPAWEQRGGSGNKHKQILTQSTVELSTKKNLSPHTASRARPQNYVMPRSRLQPLWWWRWDICCPYKKEFQQWSEVVCGCEWYINKADVTCIGHVGIPHIDVKPQNCMWLSKFFDQHLALLLANTTHCDMSCCCLVNSAQWI